MAIDFSNFDTDFRRYYERCFLFARSYTHDAVESECIASEAIAVLWEKKEAGEHIEYPLPYLFSIVRNKALHYLRREITKSRIYGDIASDAAREIQLRIDSLEECNPHTLYTKEVREIFRDSLQEMGDKTRQIIELSRFEGMSNAEIAKQLNLSEKGIEYHITKALKILRTNLKDYLPLIAILLGIPM